MIGEGLAAVANPSALFLTGGSSDGAEGGENRAGGVSGAVAVTLEGSRPLLGTSVSLGWVCDSGNAAQDLLILRVCPLSCLHPQPPSSGGPSAHRA